MKKLIFLMIIVSITIYSEEFKLSPSIITHTTGFNKSLIEENKNTTLITKEEIEKKQYTNVESILRDVPNVVVQNTQFGPIIALRGSGERSISRIKILVDGINITPLEEAMGTIPINSIPVTAIEKIEIIHGGGATLYGSGTTGGVINIITNSDEMANNLKLNLTTDSYSTLNNSIAFGQNLTDTFYINLAGQYTKKSEGYRENEDLKAKNFIGGFDYKINSKHRLKFQSTYFEDKGKNSTEISKELLKNNRKLAGEKIDFESKRDSFSLDYEYKLKDNWTLYTNIFTSEYKRDFTQSDNRDFPIPKISGMPFNIVLPNLSSNFSGNFSEKNSGIKLKSKFEYENGTFISGYDYTFTNLKRDSFVETQRFNFSDGKLVKISFLNPLGNISGKVTTKTTLDIDKESHAFYLLNNYNLTEKLSLISGIRYEYSDYNGHRSSNANLYGYDIDSGILGSVIFPPETQISNSYGVRELANDNSKIEESFNNYAGEIGLNYQFSESGNIFTRYERGYITPLPSQLTNKIEENGIKKYTQSGINPEIIDSIEIGIKNMINNTFISTSIFFSQTSDEITTLDKNANNPALKLWQFKNIGETQRIGLELYAQQYFDKFTLTGGINYIDAKISKVDENDWLKKGDKVPMVPSWKFTFDLDYAIMRNLNIGATYIYNGGYEMRELETYEKTKVSGYGVTNIYAKYGINNYVTLNLGVNNIFNELYNYYENSTMAIPAPERNYYLGISISL